MSHNIYPSPNSHALYPQCLNTLLCEEKIKRSLAATKNPHFFPKFRDNLAQCLARFALSSTAHIICPPDLRVCESGIINGPFWSIHPDLIHIYLSVYFSWSALDCWLNAYHHCNLLQVRKVVSSKKETYKQLRSDGHRGCQEYTWTLQWLREWIHKEE